MQTDGRRIYAIGDVHGCRAELAALHAAIRADLDAHPHPDPVLIHLGDYVDRGADCRGVIEDIRKPVARGLEQINLLGNHDAIFLHFLDDPDPSHCAYHWLTPEMGGAATLASYGVPEGLDRTETHAQALAAVPAADVDYIANLPLWHRVGDYLFVHAGIRPGVEMAAQVREDLYWIRAPFLDYDGDHGFVVVHGHTVVRAVEVRSNRIGIDTGAVFGRHLTCLVLEGGGAAILSPRGRRALPLPY